MNIFTQTIGWFAFLGILVAFVPQAIKCVMTKSVKGISLTTFLIQLIGNYLCVWGGTFLNSIQVGFLNVIVLYFALIIFSFILLDRGMNKRLVITIATSIAFINTITGIIEILNYIQSQDHNNFIPILQNESKTITNVMNPWFVTIFTASAGLAIAGAFIPQVISTFKTKDVKNISLSTSLIYTFGNSMYVLFFILNIIALPGTAPGWAPSLISVSVTAILQVVLIIWKLQWGEKKPIDKNDSHIELMGN